jgi:hypothetical protein
MTFPTKFYMVAGSGPTSARHATRVDAEEQALRLAERYPGKTFAVMEAMSVATVLDGKAELAMAMPPSLSPADYEPLPFSDKPMKFPAAFALFTPTGEPDCPHYAVTNDEDELSWLLYNYEPTRLGRAAIEDVPHGDISGCDFASDWPTRYDPEKGIPENFGRIVARRRKYVPKLKAQNVDTPHAAGGR